MDDSFFLKGSGTILNAHRVRFAHIQRKDYFYL